MTVDATGRSIYNAYMAINDSEKADHPARAVSRVPLPAMTWRDVFNAADAVEQHLAAGGGRPTVANIYLSLPNVLHRCALAGTDLGHIPKALSQGIQKRCNAC